MGPEGVTEQSWITNYKLDHLAYNGFTFEYSYELVKGDWSISAALVEDGREIYHASFTVIDPMLIAAPPCGSAPLS